MRLVVLIVTIDFKCEVIDFDVKHVKCINKDIPTWRCVKSEEENHLCPVLIFAWIWIFVRGLTSGCSYFLILRGFCFMFVAEEVHLINCSPHVNVVRESLSGLFVSLF